MLDAYLAQVQSLLDDPSAVEYTTADLTVYINDARVQVAGASESLRYPATLALAATQQSYAFSSAVIAGAVGLGLAGVLDIRMVALIGGGQLEMRSWEWFFSYYLAVPSPPSGSPAVCAVLLPGIAGSIWFAPIPAAVGSVLIDAVCYPVALADDTTPEALPYPWQEAVQYYAAYLAYLNAQRRTDADAMFARYQVFEERATQMTTPSRLPRNYPGGRGARLAGAHMPITAQPPQAGRGG